MGIGSSAIKKTLWATLLAVFLGVMFLSLFHVPAGMGMSGGVSTGCPFMSHEEVICSMSTLDHLTAWKSAFTATTQSLALLLVTAAALALVPSVAPHLLSRSRFRDVVYTQYPKERTYTFSYRPLQELFSSGILHPKIF